MQDKEHHLTIVDARSPMGVPILAAIYVTVACVLLVSLAVTNLLCPGDVSNCLMRVHPRNITGPIFAAIFCILLTCAIGAGLGSRGARRWLTIVGAVMALGWTAGYLVSGGGMIGLLVPAAWIIAHLWGFFGSAARNYFARTRQSVPRA
jgi:hypothetical protein